ncbi:lipopolysaccharide kinase (Kdo/WaaP) family protein [mine drainage metagenome]|uniref:Lipopolysaccharide kinase (Kdo/WaaP) family protein n=1 Tax=mine drainage metagenome TaxID=410659 RepID=A0A1J5RUP8_9ZZZZ
MSLPVRPAGQDDRNRVVRTLADGTVIEDSVPVPVHRPGDLLGAVGALAGIVLVMLFVVYAHGTTAGVSQDVQGFAADLGRALQIPVAVLEWLLTLVAPLAVLVELAVRRLGRQVVEAVAAAAVALTSSVLVGLVVEVLGSTALVRGLSVRVGANLALSVPTSLASVVALLVASGPRVRRRTVAWSWNLLWVSLAIIVVTGQVSLPGTTVAFLLGVASGLGIRYALGVTSGRVEGRALVDGIVRAGVVPVHVVRLDDTSESRSFDDRTYEITSADGRIAHAVVMDADRQVVGTVSRLWRAVRLRGVEGRSIVSLRQAAERAALATYAARAAGVRTPALVGMAEAADSMLLVIEHLDEAVALRELPEDELTDTLLARLWDQIRKLHAAGIAHRALTSASILVDRQGGQPRIWLTGWDSADVAASELSRRMDVTQVVAMLATRIGATRAVDSAARALPDAEVAAVGPLLQTVVLPRQTRVEVRERREVLSEVRAALVARMPDADVEPQRLVRFGARSVLKVILPVAAAIIVLTSVNVDQISTALASSDWRWAAVAFLLGLATFVGAGLAFAAFAPVRISLWSATLVHAVGAFVGLVTPAGLGSAALNLRMLTKRGVTMSLAVATVALVQVSQLTVTVLLLVFLSVVSGTTTSTQFAPSTGTLVLIAVLAAAAGASLLVPTVRQWVVRTTLPTIRQTWPRLVEIAGEPRRLAVAVTGNVLLTMGYVLAFDATLAAFGQHLSLVQVALVFLIGNTAGAIVPTPGGLGTIEVAFIGGLTASGINPGIAASVTILFRVLTYWLPIPIGWLALRRLQSTGEL